MKKLIAACAFIALLASPAFAKKNHGHAPASPSVMEESNNGPNGKVVWGGRVKAQDPDPFIRLSIVRGITNYGCTCD